MNWDKGRAYHEVMDYQLILLDKITREKKITYIEDIIKNLYSISDEEFNANTFSNNIDQLDSVMKKYQIDILNSLVNENVALISTKLLCHLGSIYAIINWFAMQSKSMIIWLNIQ